MASAEDRDAMAYRIASDIRRIAGDMGRDPLVLAAEIIMAQERLIPAGLDRSGQPEDPRPLVDISQIAG